MREERGRGEAGGRAMTPRRRKTDHAGEDFRVRRTTVALAMTLVLTLLGWKFTDDSAARTRERDNAEAQDARDREQDGAIAALRTQAEQSPVFRTREIEREIETRRREHDSLERRVSRLEDNR